MLVARVWPRRPTYDQGDGTKPGRRAHDRRTLTGLVIGVDAVDLRFSDDTSEMLAFTDQVQSPCHG